MTADDALIARISERLLTEPEPVDPEVPLIPDWVPDDAFDRPPIPAAVLVPLIRRPAGLTVLYTERSPALRAHSGQIAFPGGKVDPEDAGPGAAALREAAEEIGLVPEEAEILGYMPPYYTGTNYLITPVVALVLPSGAFVPNPNEVSAVFEVPLSMLVEEKSYATFRVKRRGVDHSTWQLDHEGRTIWGITANLTRRFRDLALAAEEAAQ